MEASYYAIITADVRYSDKINANEKLLYAEITALSNKTGFCWASNNHFADLYNCTPQAISKWVKNLEKNNFISVEYVYKKGSKEIEKRIISIGKGVNADIKGINSGFNTYQHTIKDNNTSINNKLNNSEGKEIPSPTHEEIKDELFPNYNSVNLNFEFGEEIPKKVAQKKVLFGNSDIYKLVNFEKQDYSKFFNLFKGPEFEQIDLVYYFNAVNNWSDAKDQKRTSRGWKATVLQFISGDSKNGKVKLKPEFQPNKNDDNQAMLDILNSR